jgi:protease I
MTLKALILIGPDFEDREVFYPFYRLKEAGISVTTAGIGAKDYKGKYGVPLSVDGQCEDYLNEHWDLVIAPGGWAGDKIRMNQAALHITKTTHQQGRLIAAICHGGWVLASAKVLEGVKCTSYVAIKDDMINAGGHWVDEEVVVDKGVVTSRTPDDLPAFCKAMLKALGI